MKNKKPSKTLINVIVIGAGILFSGILLGLLLVGVNYMRPGPAAGSAPTAAQTVIPPPTRTPVLEMPTQAATPTPTSTAEALIPPANVTLAIGNYVQISGTGGDGLRLRAEAGRDNPIRFLGMEAEVFQIKDGPRQADGLTWWLLVAPYDATRTGWAVSNYLVAVQSP